MQDGLTHPVDVFTPLPLPLTHVNVCYHFLPPRLHVQFTNLLLKNGFFPQIILGPLQLFRLLLAQKLL